MNFEEKIEELVSSYILLETILPKAILMNDDNARVWTNNLSWKIKGFEVEGPLSYRGIPIYRTRDLESGEIKIL